MFDPNDLIAVFDPETRIVHLTARVRITVKTIEEGLSLSQAVRNILDKYLKSEPGYLISDIGQITIEPELIELHGREIKDIIDKYLFPGGIARYGMGLTRATARASHAEYIGGDPNLFNLKEEAYAYINDLIEEQKDTKLEKTFHPLWG